MEKFSLPLAARYLKTQTESTLQFVNKKTGEIISFNESYLERAKNLGKYSAYHTYTTDELKKISNASSVMENPEDFAAFPRLDKIGKELDYKTIMLEFASSQGSENENVLKKSLGGLFGSVGKFEKTLGKLGLAGQFADFEKEKYEAVLIDWAEQNQLEYTEELIEETAGDESENFELDDDFVGEDTDVEAGSDESEDAPEE